MLASGPVYVTKYQRDVFTKAVLDELRTIFTNVYADFEAELMEFRDDGDHVHFLVNHPFRLRFRLRSVA